MADVVEVLEHCAAGRPLRAIAKSLGLDRNTVAKYVGRARQAGFGPGTGPPSEGWAAFVAEVCPELGQARRNGAAWDELAARHDEILERLKVNRPSTVWQRMHDDDGLQASLPSFRRYALATFPEAYGRRQGITVLRDDPPPGEEAQVDYGRLGKWTDPKTGETMILNAFILVLSFSRHMFVAVVRHMDAAAWLECHVRAFAFFGATPARIILDNLKSGVLHPDLYDPLLNRGYAELAHHFGCLIDQARSGKPKDKPRVERQVPYVRGSFWTGRTFGSLEEINTGAERWCLRVAGPRDHGTTRSAPLLLFQTIEQPAMLPLPTTPFEIVTWARAKVGRDCHAQVQTSLYSIPSRYVGQRLDVRLGSTLVRFYAGTELAKTHLRGKPGQRQTDWNDYPPEKAAFFLRTPNWCREQASRLGPHVRAAVDELLDQHQLHHLRQSQGSSAWRRPTARRAWTPPASERWTTATHATERSRPSWRKGSIRSWLSQFQQPSSASAPTCAAPTPCLASPRPCTRRFQHDGIAVAYGAALDSATPGPHTQGAPARCLQDTLSLRLDQAQQQHLGYTEFLELLLGDEIERRANRALASRLSKAHFEDGDKTFENFDWRFNPKLPHEQLRDLAAGGYVLRKEHILLCGPVGVGKTHLAEGLGHQAARQGYRVEFIKTSRLLSDLGGGRADGTWEGRLRHYLLPSVLILDDFAMREYTTHQADDLYELISERARAGSMILTSNRAPQDWYPLFPNPVLAEGALDRLLGRAHHLVLEGRSYRQPQRPDRTRQTSLETAPTDTPREHA